MACRRSPVRHRPAPLVHEVDAVQAQSAGRLLGTQEMAGAIPAGSSGSRTSSNGQDGRIPPCRCGFDSRCSLQVSRGGSSVAECERAKLATGVRFLSTALSSLAGIAQRSGNGLPPRRRGFDSRCPLLSLRGDRSMVDYEHATLVMGVRFSLTAPSFHEPDLWVGTRIANPRRRVRFPAGSPGADAPSHAPALWKGRRLLNGSTRVRLPPGALARLSSSASWSRPPDPHSGNAGSNPAGDAASFGGLAV